MMTLNLHILKKELNAPCLDGLEKLAQMELTGDVKDVLKEVSVGEILKPQSTVQLVLSHCQDLMETGSVPNWTTRRWKFVQNINSLNLSRRNRIAMAFNKIKEEFHALSEKRSTQLRKIKQCENDIVSISERLDVLSKKDDGTQEFIDQFSKAKDKRRRLRDEVADLEHDVRMTESEIEALRMEYQFVVDLESGDK